MWSGPITTVRNAARVFFPLDQRLGLQAHSWTPGTIEGALRMSIEVPSYRRAADHFSRLTHVTCAKSSLQRLVNQYGGHLVGVQAKEALAMVQVPKPEAEIEWRSTPKPDSECMNISMDGAMVNIIGQGWKEVKTVTISAVTHEFDPQTEEWRARLTRHSYRAGLWPAADFANQQWAEACRRGVERAAYLSSVNDGAAWIWNVVGTCYGRCVEILDWWHAVERLWSIAQHHFGAESADATVWVTAQKSLLAESNLRQVMRNIRQLYPHHCLPETVRKAIGYLFHNRHRMYYQHYRQAGYPIGSGSVESACKLVVQSRLKQAGMRWLDSSAQAILALRSFLLSDRWSTATAMLGLS
jgi:hypothetical protein